MATWGIEVGSNYAWLKNFSYSEPNIALQYGLTKDWRIYKGVGISSGIFISRANTKINDKYLYSSFGGDINYPHLSSVDVTIKNIDLEVQLQFTEIPIVLTVEQELSGHSAIGLMGGYTLKFIAWDHSEAVNNHEFSSAELSEQEKADFRFDCRVTGDGENYAYRGSGLCPTLGIYIKYLKFKLSLSYKIDQVKWITGIVIGNDVPFHFISIALNYQI